MNNLFFAKNILKRIVLILVVFFFSVDCLAASQLVLTPPKPPLANINDSNLTKLSGVNTYDHNNSRLVKLHGHRDHGFIVEIIYNTISIFLSILGMIFLTLMLVSGFKWMTAAGNEEKTREAIDTVRRAIVGIIIRVIAYAITRLLFNV